MCSFMALAFLDVGLARVAHAQEADNEAVIGEVVVTALS
jgi:hypothetical protein